MKKVFMLLLVGGSLSMGGLSFASDASLEEDGDCYSGAPKKSCGIWNVSYETTITVLGPTKKITCSTGGSWTCE